MFKRIGLFISVLLLTFIVGCSASNTPSNDTSSKHLLIYTSIYPIQYLAEEITKEHGMVNTVYPPGVDAHSYEPTTKEIMEIAKADSFMYLGAGMEGFAKKAAETLQGQDVLFIEIGDHRELFITSDHGEDGHDHGDLDPHIWLDPLRMIDMAYIIQDELISLAPGNEADFKANTEALVEELTLLDEEYQEVLENKKQKDIIVAHAAYGYWEERYDIKQIPISGLTAGDEPSQKELAEIVTQAKAKDLQYVIFEQNGSDRVSTIIQDHIGADALTIHNLGVLTEEDIEQGEDYLSLMRTNLDVLDRATK